LKLIHDTTIPVERVKEALRSAIYGFTQWLDDETRQCLNKRFEAEISEADRLEVFGVELKTMMDQIVLSDQQIAQMDQATKVQFEANVERIISYLSSNSVPYAPKLLEALTHFQGLISLLSSLERKASESKTSHSSSDTPLSESLEMKRDSQDTPVKVSASSSSFFSSTSATQEDSPVKAPPTNKF